MINKLISSKNKKKHPTIVFRNNVRSILKKLDFYVYENFDWVSNFAYRKFPVVGATNINNLYQLTNSLKTHGYKVIDINVPNYRGLYFEASPELIGLFISPKKEYVSLDQNILNQYRETEIVYDFKAFGAENNITDLALLDLSSAIPLWIGDELIVSEMYGIDRMQVFCIKLINSHKEYIRNYFNYKSKRNEFIFNDKYNSIEMFSWIYYWEIKIIADLLGNQNITIHDAGTSCTAYLPLLLSGLSQQELFGMNISKIYASDNGWIAEEYIKIITERNMEYKPITFVKLDLTKEIHKVPTTDVLILNDVLEHLPNDEVSLSVLKKLWDKTGKLLIAHVPFESTPNPSWDHHITFDAGKIRDWANELPGAHFLSDDFFLDDKNPLTNQGFLIAVK